MPYPLRFWVKTGGNVVIAKCLAEKHARDIAAQTPGWRVEVQLPKRKQDVHEPSRQKGRWAMTAAVLDACCGSRMFWFDRQDPRATFMDKRQEVHTLPDVSSSGGSRQLVIAPDVVADFTAMPFPDESFSLVAFDPPHFERNGATGWVGLKYRTLGDGWEDVLRRGFAECFRVLRPEGTLIFKWCAADIPLSRVLALTPAKPLFGHRSGKQQRTHWVAFMKEAEVKRGD